jgi:membrane protease YdiL (CAAX protease family)
MTSTSQDWRALPVFLVFGLALSEYPFVLHALGMSGNPNPNPLGLLVAALIAAAVDKGWRGPVGILGSMIRVRVSPLFWLAAITLPIVTVVVTLSLAAMQGIGIAIEVPASVELLDRFLIAFLFVALGEEPAWRGFLQPVLQRRLNPLLATLCLSVIWSAWHFPLMGTEFAWEIVPPFLVSVVAGAVVLAWLYNATQSTLLAMLMHATVNTVGAGFVFPAVPSDRFADFWWIYAGVWAALAAGIIILTMGRLGLADREANDLAEQRASS